MNTTIDRRSSLEVNLESSRAKLLGALAGATDITLIRNYGNMGDHLIHAGTRRLLSDVSYREVSLLQLDGLRGQLAVISGSGAWCHPHAHMPQYLPRIEAQFDRVVIFPSSFDISEVGTRQTLSKTKALVFARERTSYEQIRDVCRAELAHDCALFFDYTPYQCAGRGLLTAYRTDGEAVGRPFPPGNNDISMTCESLDEFLWTIAHAETIETDRAHVMIAGALLGKRVFYNSSNYHKVPALAEFNLPEYPVIRLGESRTEVVREHVLSQARKHEGNLPADFFAAHNKLEVTALMLSHGRVEQTLNAIRALQEHVRIPFKLLLIDNNSGETVRRSLAEVCAADERIELILLDENIGCAGGRAFGLKRVTTPYALLLDNDVEVMPGAVEHLLNRLVQHSQLAAVMGKIVFPDGLLHLCGADSKVEDGVLFFDLLGSGRHMDEDVGVSGPCRWVSGTLTLFRTAIFNTHPLDVGLGQYYEDLEWCYRVNNQLAGRFHRCIESLAIHYHEP
jgi:GT2 family glycosyltransferase/exopolysaccharide biosynthesis predicted pyruvyltransferase EpsI